MRLVGASFAVYVLGILDHRVGDDPLSVRIFLEKAVVPAGVAGDATDLLDAKQYDVLVAIHAEFAHLLHMAGFLALVPQFAARARPVYGFSAGNRLLQGRTIHPEI